MRCRLSSWASVDQPVDEQALAGAAIDVARHPLVVDRRWMHGRRRLFRSPRAEGMEDANRSGGQAFWRSLLRGGPAGNRAWQEQDSLPVGTSDSRPRRDAAAAGAERTTSSRV